MCSTVSKEILAVGSVTGFACLSGEGILVVSTYCMYNYPVHFLHQTIPFITPPYVFFLSKF